FLGTRFLQRQFPHSSGIILRMTTGTRAGTRLTKRRLLSRQDKSTPYPCWEVSDKDVRHPKKKHHKAIAQKKDWEDATCSVCLEYPHNAVLLLCSSHDKGCRPYMCATSYRYSNCLDQFEKAYAKLLSDEENLRSTGAEKSAAAELAACPLCRGKVKGWTVVEPAREYLNAKKRSCMQENCSFVGAYKELRKHVRREHPCARPREVDPALEQKWRRLENERERDDVMSTIRSSMPGSMVFGDYVIERNSHHNFDAMDEDDDDDDDEEADDDDVGSFDLGLEDNNFLNVFFLLHAIGPAGNHSLNTRLRRQERHRSLLDGERVGRGGGIGNLIAAGSGGEVEAAAVSEDDDDDVSTHVQRRGRVLLNRSERRRRRRSQRRSTDMT
ncbi:hypothetical protein MKW98_012058, partial [Papaver atlanticum]